MNLKAVGFYIGHILRIEALLMIPAALISLINHETSAAIALLATIIITFAFGQTLLMCVKPTSKLIFVREGFMIVSFGWMLLSLFGALPFIFSGEIPGFVDALFETVSGFTTTGATILTDVEIIPRGLLYWRSFTHWVGGMGVLVFVLAIMPMSRGSSESDGAMHILRAESPGPVIGKLVPRMRHTARILYGIYIALTVIEIVLLLLGGMPLFDSVVHSFGTAGTGGFSIKNASIAAYQSDYLQTVIAVFMALFGVNFNIYYLILIGDFASVLKSEELRAYIGIMLFSTLAISLNVMQQYAGFAPALHDGFFQVSSIMTTTGYSTVNFDQWPQFSRILLLVIMVVGAMAGSTGGGVKVARILILTKSLRATIRNTLHPSSVTVIKMDGKVIDKRTVSQTESFLVAYMAIMLVSTLLVGLDGKSFDTTVSSVFACLNNIGPGLGIVGPIGNFSSLSVLSKLVLTADMLLGRLEVFPVLMIFSPTLWSRGILRENRIKE